jgi:hypothetical protein
MYTVRSIPITNFTWKFSQYNKWCFCREDSCRVTSLCIFFWIERFHAVDGFNCLLLLFCALFTRFYDLVIASTVVNDYILIHSFIHSFSGNDRDPCRSIHRCCDATTCRFTTCLLPNPPMLIAWIGIMMHAGRPKRFMANIRRLKIIAINAKTTTNE